MKPSSPPFSSPSAAPDFVQQPAYLDHSNLNRSKEVTPSKETSSKESYSNTGHSNTGHSNEDNIFAHKTAHAHDDVARNEIEHASFATHEHVHSEDSLRKIVNRLSRLEGHIRGIKTMVQENRPCPDVLIQVAAVRGGLDRVARVILDEHLSECMTRAANQGNIAAEIDALKTALDRFIS